MKTSALKIYWDDLRLLLSDIRASYIIFLTLRHCHMKTFGYWHDFWKELQPTTEITSHRMGWPDGVGYLKMEDFKRAKDLNK